MLLEYSTDKEKLEKWNSSGQPSTPVSSERRIQAKSSSSLLELVSTKDGPSRMPDVASYFSLVIPKLLHKSGTARYRFAWRANHQTDPQPSKQAIERNFEQPWQLCNFKIGMQKVGSALSSPPIRNMRSMVRRNGSLHGSGRTGSLQRKCQ